MFGEKGVTITNFGWPFLVLAAVNSCTYTGDIKARLERADNTHEKALATHEKALAQLEGMGRELNRIRSELNALRDSDPPAALNPERESGLDAEIDRAIKRCISMSREECHELDRAVAAKVESGAPLSDSDFAWITARQRVDDALNRFAR